MAASQATDRLTQLPIEQITDFVTYLPPNQICRFRQVSKSAKDVVNKNEAQLARPHFRHHYNRPQQCLTYLCSPSPRHPRPLHPLHGLLRPAFPTRRHRPPAQRLGLGAARLLDLPRLPTSPSPSLCTRAAAKAAKWAWTPTAAPPLAKFWHEYQRAHHGEKRLTLPNVAAVVDRLEGPFPMLRNQDAKMKELLQVPGLFDRPSFGPVGKGRYDRFDASIEQFEDDDPWRRRGKTVLFAGLVELLRLPRAEGLGVGAPLFWVRSQEAVKMAKGAEKNGLSWLEKAAVIEVFIW